MISSKSKLFKWKLGYKTAAYHFRDDGEDLLLTFTGQVIQQDLRSTPRSSQLLYSNVLYDPLLHNEAFKQPQAAASNGLNTMLLNALHGRPTSGWFQKSVARHAERRMSCRGYS